MKILHIADVHLDAPFGWLGAKGREQRRQLRETFRAVVDLALRERVDLFLVAGDLFDSNAPGQDTIDLVVAQLGRLTMPAVLLPGTHDCFDARSIYRRVALPPTCHLLDDSHEAFTFAGTVTVHGRANLTNSSPVSPLRGIARDQTTRFNVALAHGSLAMPATANDYPIAEEEIRQSGMDYLALGHWHSFRDCSLGNTKAWYSGPPELLAQRGLGAAVLVDLTESGVTVTGVPISRRRCETLALPLDGVRAKEDVVTELRARGDGNLALAVTLTGVRPLDLDADPAALAQELAAHFFALKIADESHPALSLEEIAALPEATVIGQFARRMHALLDATAGGAERDRQEAVLQLGLALLRGRKVL